ncbi:hypothetical protein RN001_015798 [Aquatica leii]|uniref:procollagen-proline 3-dioxygenase n=1 Tax=Aquatica leii TaxID=1421715 RepID=A0AAN7NX96_9COLE|nr:hypothetical protein RN001_015798 [Aquatica leii]
MRFCTGIACLTLIITLQHALAKEHEEQSEQCLMLYQHGVQSYLENNFDDCINKLEEGVKKYNSYTKALQNCRLKCKEDVESVDPLYPVDIDNMYYYEKTIRNTLCLIKCRKAHPELATSPNLRPQTERIYDERKPYEYLHLCYYQKKQFQKAASAVFTYLVVHAKDDAATKSLKFYSTLPEVDMKEIVNFEAKDHIYLYIHGVDAYDKKDWKAVENNMEESLVSYLQAEEECRALCEGPFDQGWYPDLIPSIANHYTFALNCKTKCAQQLNNLNGEYHDDLLPSHYHYLQFAYFKNNNLKAACQAAASYVLFYPNDDTMRSNMEYYKSLPKVENNFFTPRPEAVYYVRRLTYEKRLLKFIDTEYRFNETDGAETKEEKSTEKYLSSYCKAPQLEILTNHNSNIQLVMDNKDLNGTKRFVVDGLLTPTECKTMLRIAQDFAQKGDGYKGNPTPHTVLETFKGISIGRAALLFHFGRVNYRELYLYLKSTEIAKKLLEDNFSIKQTLYFTYTHLVCRSSLSGNKNRTDFSHSIHADNCNIGENGICRKSLPAYIWRDYSAIIYLNNNFDGGDFIFSQDMFGNFIQSTIKPKCGRMIGFSSGAENLHGVKAVTRGTRCAIAIWFTFNKKYKENDRTIAYKLLHQFMN